MNMYFGERNLKIALHIMNLHDDLLKQKNGIKKIQAKFVEQIPNF